MSRELEQRPAKLSRLLIYNDDPASTQELVALLKSHEYETLIAPSFEVNALDSFPGFDLIVLNLRGEDEKSFQFCKTLRDKQVKTPIFIISTSEEIDFKEKCLSCGADDFLTEPFEAREMLARVRALLKRPKNIHTSILRVQGLSLDTESGQLSLADKPNSLQLRPKEAAVLEFFMRRPSQVYSPQYLLDSLWPSDAQVTESSIWTCIKTLRKKILDSFGIAPIKTVAGFGYKLDL